jgi:hypothetical protein
MWGISVSILIDTIQHVNNGEQVHTLVPIYIFLWPEPWGATCIEYMLEVPGGHFTSGDVVINPVVTTSSTVLSAEPSRSRTATTSMDVLSIHAASTTISGGTDLVAPAPKSRAGGRLNLCMEINNRNRP